MKVIVAEQFGICFGVRDAIAQAHALARKGPLTILGELVHNPIVREQLRSQGIQEEPRFGFTLRLLPVGTAGELIVSSWREPTRIGAVAAFTIFSPMIVLKRK